MYLGKYCPNCGFVFHGQRTGKCPNCDLGALIKEDRLYRLNPADIRRFEEFDQKGSDIPLQRSPNDPNITVIQLKEKKRDKWIILSVLGAIITYADYGHGPEIIYALENADGFSINDFPKKIMSKATATAARFLTKQ